MLVHAQRPEHVHSRGAALPLPQGLLTGRSTLLLYVCALELIFDFCCSMMSTLTRRGFPHCFAALDRRCWRLVSTLWVSPRDCHDVIVLIFIVMLLSCCSEWLCDGDLDWSAGVR